jgi:N-acetyl sugar amidotransferase
MRFLDIISKTVDIDKKYNLPKEIKYCKRCVMSNQRPRIKFDQNGICAPCNYFDFKKTVDWNSREKELMDICNKYRSKDGTFDCVVPSSGGKDSAWVAHELKTKYKMHPLTVTWSPLKYSDIGWENLQNFNDHGFDIIMGIAKGDVRKRLCRDAMIEMGDPFQPFIYGQYLFPMSIALKYGIKLVFGGENAEVEYGGCDNNDEGFVRKERDIEEYDEIWFSKYSVNFWLDKGYTEEDLNLFQGCTPDEINKAGIKRLYYSYFRNWSNHKNFYYAVENTGFKPNAHRTEGTYTKYSSIDDKIDGFHHWFSLLKFGIGRCTANAAREIREGYITREEGVSLVNRYDSEFPKKYFDVFLNYTGLSDLQFWQIADRWRNKRIWVKKNTNDKSPGDDWEKKNKLI